MIDIMISRLIAAAVAALLVGWACYVTAYVKHKNEAKDEENKILLQGCELYAEEKVKLERSGTWFFGYSLALIGLTIVSAAVGWAAAYIISGEYVLGWAEDCAVAVIGAVIGGLVLDKYIIHPIADGKFFEKVEDPLVDYFLENGSLPVKEVKLSRKEKKQLKKEAAEVVQEVSEPDPVPIVEDPKDLVAGMSFDEKVKLIDLLKKNL